MKKFINEYGTLIIKDNGYLISGDTMSHIPEEGETFYRLDAKYFDEVSLDIPVYIDALDFGTLQSQQKPIQNDMYLLNNKNNCLYLTKRELLNYVDEFLLNTNLPMYPWMSNKIAKFALERCEWEDIRIYLMYELDESMFTNQFIYDQD